MATVTRTRIDGLDHAIKQFRRAPDLAKKFIGGAIQQTELHLAQKVRQGAPKDTGALELSIGSKTTGLTAHITIESGELYGRRPEIYWRFVEFGTIRMAAQPFIRPAAETEQQPMIARIAQAGARLEDALSI